jgi:hypothetical protein
VKTDRFALWLVVLACAIPAFFIGSSYLMHARGLDVPVSPYGMLAASVVLALYVYGSTVFQAFNRRELLKSRRRHISTWTPNTQ